MALLHEAELRPTKLELLATWLPTRTWYAGEPGAELTRVSACRFDDPAGEVGIETMLVRAGSGPVLHAPLTYRGAPLDGADAWLVGTMDHSVLGPRWVYDACGDPVYAAVLAHAIFIGAGEAEEFIEAADGRRQQRAPAMSMRGSGPAEGSAGAPAVTRVVRVDDADPTRIVTDSVELLVVRRPEPGEAGHPLRLDGTWDGGPATVLAYANAD